MYCGDCGKNLEENEVCECQKQEKAEGRQEKMKNKKLLTIISGAVVVFIISIVLLIPRPDKIHMEEYLVEELYITGLDGYGTLQTDSLFHSSKFVEDVAGQNTPDGENMSDFMQLGTIIDECEKIENSIVIEVYVNGKLTENLSNLKNGDKIKVEVSSNMGGSKEFDKKFVDGSREYELTSLEKAKVVSPFDEEYFSISFQGGNGAGKVKWKKNDTHKLANYIDFNIASEKLVGFSNGDKVTFEVEYDEETLMNEGYVLSETTKTFTVKGLGEYITSVNKIPQDLLLQLKNDSANKLAADVDANDYEKPAYQKMYFMSKKKDAVADSDMDGQPQNILLIVYTTKTRSWSFDFYACVYYSEITMSGKTILFDGHKSEADGATVEYYAKHIFEGDMEKYKEIYDIETIE